MRQVGAPFAEPVDHRFVLFELVCLELRQLPIVNVRLFAVQGQRHFQILSAHLFSSCHHQWVCSVSLLLRFGVASILAAASPGSSPLNHTEKVIGICMFGVEQENIF